MSIEAMTWVFRNSPYKGVQRLIHLAIADVVNDGYQNRFWMKQGQIAEKAGCTRQTVNETVAKMVSEDALRLVESNKGPRPNVYEFQFSVGKSDSNLVSANPTGNQDLMSAEPTVSVGRADNKSDYPYSINSKKTQDPPKKPQDPESEAAQRLAVMAFGQPIKPASSFIAVRANIQRLLKAGHSEQHIADAIEQNRIMTWTIGSMEIGIKTAFHANETASWLPSEADLDRACIYDSWDTEGHWLDSSGKMWEQHPQLSGIDPPIHPDGGLYDSYGARYTQDPQSGQRRYLQSDSIGA